MASSHPRTHIISQDELETAQKDLSLTRVDIRKHEKSGYKKSIEHMQTLVAQVAPRSNPHRDRPPP